MTRFEPARSVPGPRHQAYWPLTWALLLLLVVGSGALAPLLRGTGWMWAMTFTVTIVLISTAGFRRLGVRRSFVPITGLGVLLTFLTLVFGAGTGLVWLIPTPDTFTVFQGLIDSGIDSIRQQSTPAAPVAGITFLLASGVGLIAVLVDALAITLRWPALAGIPVLIPVGVPGLIIDGGAEIFSLVLAAGAFLVLLWFDARVRRTEEANQLPEGRSAPRVFARATRLGPGPMGGAVAVGSIGIVSALVLSAATPAFTEHSPVGSGNGSLLFGSGVSPMIDLGQDLRRPRPQPALHYTTTAVAQPYFKLLTLDRFVGTTWVASTNRINRDNTVQDITRSPELSKSVESVETTTSVVIDGVDTAWLPVPPLVTRVEGLGGSWYWDSHTRAIRSFDSSTLGQSYQVTALELKPTAGQLRDSSSEYPQSVLPAMDLPTLRPDIIDDTARAVTSGTGTPYDAAVALQDYLRGGEFAYDTDAPVDDGYDGGGVDVIGTFLELQRGYCVHFASAMAVMARSLGIPARVAVGYLPGTKTSDGVAGAGAGQFNINSNDLHSWPELYFGGVGWVSFEPTPGRGRVPAYARPADSAGPGSASGATLPTSAPRAGDDGLTTGGGSVNSAAGSTSGSDALLRVGALAALIVCLMGGPAAARSLRRQGRMRRLRRGSAGAATAWAELGDSAIDHAVRVTELETPRELARRLSGLPGLDGDAAAAEALDRLLVALERHRYARPEEAVAADQGADLADDLDIVTEALHRASDRAARVRALTLPASLWPAVLARQNSGRIRNA
ncbi:MAG: hypothetical protein JWQ68_881 [Cryobacterium sp.]|nr:hypothetical protein [Cryobacterium sp.]